jgi:hypothetical protein
MRVREGGREGGRGRKGGREQGLKVRDGERNINTTTPTHFYKTEWIKGLFSGINNLASSLSTVISDRPSRKSVPLMGNLEVDGRFRCPVPVLW